MSNVSFKQNSAEQKPLAKKPGVTWGPFAAIFVTLGSLLASGIGVGLLVFIVPNIFGLKADTVNDWLDSTVGQFVFVLIMEAITVGVLLLFLHRRKTGMRALGFSRKPAVEDVGRAIVAYLIYFVTMIAVTSLASSLLHINVNQKQELGFDNVIGLGEKLMTFISLVVLPPLTEEILFRGFLFTGLRKRLKFMWATAIVSVFFASLHLLESSEGMLWVAGIDTLILSFVLCYLREKTSSLWPSIFVHAIKNGVAFIFLYIVVAK